MFYTGESVPEGAGLLNIVFGVLGVPNPEEVTIGDGGTRGVLNGVPTTAFTIGTLGGNFGVPGGVGCGVCCADAEFVSKLLGVLPDRIASRGECLEDGVLALLL